MSDEEEPIAEVSITDFLLRPLGRAVLHDHFTSEQFKPGSSNTGTMYNAGLEQWAIDKIDSLIKENDELKAKLEKYEHVKFND